MNYHNYKSNNCHFLPERYDRKEKNLIKEEKDNNSSYISDLGRKTLHYKLICYIVGYMMTDVYSLHGKTAWFIIPL